MITVVRPEPLLAEAPCMIMAIDEEGAPRALQKHIEESFLSVGDRGDLVAALILTLARDKPPRNRKMRIHVENIHNLRPASNMMAFPKAASSLCSSLLKPWCHPNLATMSEVRGSPSVPQVIHIHSRRILRALSVIRTYLSITSSRCTTARW